MHAILTYQLETDGKVCINGNLKERKIIRKSCINRDHNAVINMRTLVQYYLITGERMEEFKRH